MKALLLACLVPLAVIPTRAQERSTGAKVVGILDLPGWKRTVLEFPNPFNGRTAYTILAEGESDGPEISVSQILPEVGTVKGRLKSPAGFLDFEVAIRTNQGPSDTQSVNLDGVNLNMVLRLYSIWSKKTLLRWPSLPEVKFSIQASATNQAEA